MRSRKPREGICLLAMSGASVVVVTRSKTSNCNPPTLGSCAGRQGPALWARERCPIASHLWEGERLASPFKPDRLCRADRFFARYLHCLGAARIRPQTSVPRQSSDRLLLGHPPSLRSPVRLSVPGCPVLRRVHRLERALPRSGMSARRTLSNISSSH